jgi:hypothetical protein
MITMLIAFILSYVAIERVSKYLVLGKYMWFDLMCLKHKWFDRISAFNLFHCESCVFFWTFFAYCYSLGELLPWDTGTANLYSLMAFLIHKTRENERLKKDGCKPQLPSH